MARSAQVVVNNVVRAYWDDDVEQYVELAADGVTETLRRAYSVVEKDQKNERIARNNTMSVHTNLIDQSKTNVAAIRAAAGRLIALRDNRTDAQLAGNTAATAATIRLIINELLIIARGTVAPNRVIGQDLNSADTGPI